MPEIPDSNSSTSKIAIVKVGLSVAAFLGGVVFAATGNMPVALALLGIAAQGGVSAAGLFKAADAPK